jgi:Pyruvate/2-oxoacid:ferredoxin oxidoreductase gamma subunit
MASWGQSWGVSWGNSWGAVSTATVPDVVGLDQAAAIAAIEAEGFNAAAREEYSSTVAAGLVISQTPVAGSTAATGSTVIFVLSLGERAETGAGRSKKRRSFVEIDGEVFEVRDAQHAQALLDRARELAARHAQELAQKAVQTSRKVGKKPIKLPTPRITSPDPELREVVREARQKINAVYRQTALDMELAYLMARQLELEDEEEAILLLL